MGLYLWLLKSSRAFVYRGFLTNDECDHLITMVSFSSFLLVEREIKVVILDF